MGIFFIKRKDYKNNDFIFIEDIENTKISLFSIYFLSKKKRIYLIIKNFWLATGHCIYPSSCNKWELACSNCPNLYSSIPLNFDTTSLLFQFKLSIISRSNLELIVENEEIKNALKNSPIISDMNINVIDPAIDRNFAEKSDTLNLKTKLNIPLNSFIIGMRGALKQDLRDAIENIFENLPNSEIIYLVTIDIDFLIEIKNVVHINIQSNAGKYSENDAVLLCDIWVLFDFFEGFSRFILKAMISKKLIISTNLIGVKSLLRHPEGGIVVPSSKFLDIKSAIIYFVNNRSSVIEYGLLASDIAHNFYTYKNFFKSVSQLLYKNHSLDARVDAEASIF
jgi:glycosyltransferase involved in cell wall biosynthesis